MVSFGRLLSLVEMRVSGGGIRMAQGGFGF